MSKLVKTEQISLFNRISAAISTILLVLHFIPFWKYGDGMSASICGLVWMPYNHTSLTAELTASLGSFSIDSLVSRSTLLCVLCIAAIVICLMRSDNCISSIIPIASGIVGVWAFLSSPALKLGSGWSIYLILSILLILTGVLALLMGLKGDEA